MPEVIAIRMDQQILKKIERLGKEEAMDRSTVLRKLILKGYQESLKENAAQSYKEGKITFSEAAHIAGLTLWEMEHFLVDKGFKSEYSIDDLQRELKLLK